MKLQYYTSGVENTAAFDAGLRLMLAEIAQNSPDLFTDDDWLNDAMLVTPFSLDDPTYAQDMTISVGAGRDSTKWAPKAMPVALFVDMLSRHREDPKKDGLAFVLAEIVGPNRRKVAVKACHGVGLDIDVGVPGERIDSALAGLGCLAIRYTTHSHGKARTEFKKDRLIRYADGIGAELDDQETIARFLREKEHWDESIIVSAEYVGDEHRPEGLMALINHAPMPKHRVVMPFAEPFVITQVAKTQDEGMRLWNQVPKALARLLGDLPLDKAALDPSRLFYFPRHAKGCPHATSIFGGPLLDWRMLPLDEADAAHPHPQPIQVGGSRADAIDKRWAARRADGLQVVDLIRDHASDRLRSDRGEKAEIECPFDEEHSNAGDPDDRACLVVNAGDQGGFVVTCRHDCCQGRDRLDFLNEMIRRGWFGSDDLEEYDALDRSAGEVPQRAGAIAVGGVLDSLSDFDPDCRVFAGPNACEDAITELRKVVSVLTQGNRTRLAIRTRNGLVFNSRADAATRYNSYRAIYETTDAQGKPKVKEVGALDLLLKSDRVRIFDGIDCDPTDSLPAHILNTWEGIKISPAPGDCSRLLSHLLNSVCAGNEAHYKVLLGFFGHMFQKPAEKPGFAPVVIGPKGSGKSTVAHFLCRAIGPKHSVKIAQAKHLTGAFNAHLAGKLFVQAEEVTFGGDKKGEGVLKDAITATTMLTEPKGLDAYQETNFTRFFLVTNPGHAVPASDGERRWFVLQAVDLFDGKPLDDPERVAYFNALYQEAENGGIAAFVHYLSHYEISDFLPFAPPLTNALADQVRRSLGDEDLWVLGALETGQFDTRDGEPLGEEWLLSYAGMKNPNGSAREGMEIDCADLQRSFDSHVRRYGGSSGGSGVCRAVLERYGAVEKRRRGSGTRQNYYILGPRSEWQATLTKRFGITFAAEAREGEGRTARLDAGEPTSD